MLGLFSTDWRGENLNEKIINNYVSPIKDIISDSDDDFYISFSGLGNKNIISIDSEIVKLEVYDNQECTGDALETFSLRL